MADAGSDAADAAETGADAALSRGARAMLERRARELSAGATSVGWKIGFNAPAIQAHFGLRRPVVGYLIGSGVAADGSTVPVADWAAPAVEVEVAIRVGPDGGVAGLAPALELVDLGEPFADIEAALGGNIWQRGVVFGDEVPGVDPWAMVARVTRTRSAGGAGSGEPVTEGSITEDPATTVAFVASFLEAHGAALAAGDRIIAGSVVAPIAVTPGEALVVDFGPLGHLNLSFS